MKKHRLKLLIISGCLLFLTIFSIGMLQHNYPNFEKNTSSDNFITFQIVNHCNLAFLPNNYSFERIKYQVYDLSYEENFTSKEKKVGQVLELTNYEESDTYIISIAIASIPLPFSILRSDYETNSTLLIDDVAIHYQTISSKSEYDLSTFFTFQYSSHYYYATLTYQSTTTKFTTQNERESFFTQYLRQTFFQ